MFEHGLSLLFDVFLHESPSPDAEELFSHIYVKSHGAQVYRASRILEIL